jgi:aryl-alcohol dehydrogenase-like predicted oxidoreductase
MSRRQLALAWLLAQGDHEHPCSTRSIARLEETAAAGVELMCNEVEQERRLAVEVLSANRESSN